MRDVRSDAFQFVFNKGPYCNNNLGTVSAKTYPDAWFTPFPYPITLPAPFTNGVPLFPGLVSDADASGVLTTSYARVTAPYPHSGTSATGGSGAGRDALGVNAFAFEYNDASGRYSDNPNNCRRPADACRVTAAQAGGDTSKAQDGGPEWDGISSACEYPNTSNNSDDATFKVSEQVTSIIPYMQGELRQNIMNR